MKRFLLPLFAMSMMALPAMADEVYGTSPETAKPFPSTGMGWFVPTLDEAPAEAWFTITNDQTSPVLWGSPTSDPDGKEIGRQIFVYLCNGGSEAFQMTEGSDSYVLLPGQEYLVKITPKAPGLFCMGQPLALPESMKGKRKYYPIDKREEQNTGISTDPGTTWYLYDFNYPAPLQLKTIFGMPAMGVSEVEAIHIECPGGVNIGDGIIPPYVKAGKSVIGVTIPEDATFDFGLMIGLDAMSAFSCNNNLLRGQGLELDAKTTYPDAYYTVDKFFKVPEDGTYTFTNHGAKGTILNIGKVVLTDPENQYKYECDWTDIKSATVGENDAAVVVDGLKAGEIVLVQSDAFGIIGEGLENAPYLLVQTGDQTSVADVGTDADAIVASVVGGVLNVKSVLLAAGAEVAVYDMAARKVAGTVAPANATELNMPVNIAAGTYVVVVYGKGNSETVKVVVK